MFKKVEESIDMLRRDTEERKQTQILLLETKNVNAWDKKYTG